MAGQGGYPARVKTAAQRALYNNLGKDEEIVLAVDAAIQGSRMDGWRGNAMKTKKVRLAIREVLSNDDALTDRILELAKHQNDY